LSGPVTLDAVTRLLPPLALLAALVLGACSEAEDAIRDAASDAASDAACAVGRTAVTELKGQVDGIARDIGADPAAARRELTAIRESLAAAERGLGGETRERVRQAREAVDELLAQARAGTTVDDEAVAAAQEEYDAAAAELTNIC
jgi:hypothetical protein